MLQRAILLLMIMLSLKMAAQSPEWVAAGMPLYGRQVRNIYTDTTNNIMYVTGEIMATPTSFSTQFICKYEGSSWTTIGVFDGQVLSVATYQGNLIASGFFNTINGIPVFSIARYDGTSWYPIGNFDDGVFKVKVIDTNLYALGAFNSVDGISAKRIAKWDGTGWTDVHHFLADTMDGILEDVAIYKGNIYICGNFVNSVLGINHLAVYKEGIWQNVGGGVLGSWTDLVEFAIYRDELYLAGSILKPAGNVGHMIQKWNDTIWSEVGSSVQDLSNGDGFCGIRDMLVHNNELYIAGAFGYAGHIPATYIAKWDGLKWCGLGTKDLFTAGAGAQGGNALGFYNDTLYLGIGNDTLNSVQTNRIIKYKAGSYVDTCSIEYTGIENFSIENTVKIYPNPAIGQLMITFEVKEFITSNTTLQIKNILGQTIKTFSLQAGQNQLEIDVSDLPKGLYFLRIKNPSFAFSKKIIKQ